MQINLSKQEIVFLKDKDIEIDVHLGMTDEQAFNLLEKVSDIEIFYANGNGESDLRLAKIYGDIYDKIQEQIPEN